MPPRLRWLVAGLGVGSIAALGLNLRGAMLGDRLPIEGQYAVNVQFGPWYLANEGRLFNVTGDIPALSNYTSGVSYGAVDFVHTLLHGSALMIAGLTTPDEIGQAYVTLPWQSLILVPLAVIAVYARMCRIRNAAIEPFSVFLLYALATTAHYTMVNWGLTGGGVVPYGWASFIAVYIVLITRSGTNGHPTNWSLLLVALVCLVQPTYHTIAVALLVIFATIVVGQRWSPFQLIRANTVLVAAVAFAAFLAYSATPFLRAYSVIGLGFVNDLFRSYDAAASQYLYRLSGPLVTVQIVSYLAIASIAMTTLVLWFQSRHRPDRVLWHHALWIVGLIPLGIGFFAWNGILGVQARLLQLGTLLAMCSAAILLVDGRRFSRRIATIAIGTTVICTLVTLPQVHLGKNAFLSADEWEALNWYADEVGCESVLFTDFRIGTAATYAGCFKVIGPTAGTLSRLGRSDVISDLYYTGGASEVSDAILSMATTEGETASYALFSTEMTDPNVGPTLPDGRLHPISAPTWRSYRDMPNWTIVYQNGSVLILGHADGRLRSLGP